jgi:hypothetical protein
MDVFFGLQMTIDVSNEAGSRWDQSITGSWAAEMFALRRALTSGPASS